MKMVNKYLSYVLTFACILITVDAFAQFSSTPNTTLTDGGCFVDFGDGQGPETFNLTVSGLPNSLDGTCVSLNSVCIRVTSEYIGDVQASLVSPSGVSVTLLSVIGEGDNIGNGNRGNNFDICLTPTATMSIDVEEGNEDCNGPNPPCKVGDFLPKEPLSGFEDNSDPNGIWILEVCDKFNADLSTLNTWELNFNSITITDSPDIIIVDENCDGTPGMITYGTCPLGTSIEYSTDGTMWSATPIVYDQDNPIDVYARCSCAAVSGPIAMASTAPNPICTPVPTMGEWGLISLGLLLLILGVVSIKERQLALTHR